ncbi:MAG: hypothetical protein GX752_03940 [Clostridium sp.]|nr:hypothetical protein [Clostridium sp.]
MINIKIHLPRCSGHERKNNFINNVVSKVSKQLSLRDQDIKAILYESEFRSDTKTNSKNFVLIEVLACSGLSEPNKNLLSLILKEEVIGFSGNKDTHVSVCIFGGNAAEKYDFDPDC